MNDAVPLDLYQTTVLPEWVDYNGHMNDAMYNVAFSRAVDALMDYIGMNATFRARTQATIYTLETHVCYLREVKQGAPLRVTAQLLDSDAKRLRVFLAMFHGEDGQLLATSEQMLICIDTAGPHSAPFAPEVMAQVEALRLAHTRLPAPKQAGRFIRLRRRSDPDGVSD